MNCKIAHTSTQESNTRQQKKKKSNSLLQKVITFPGLHEQNVIFIRQHIPGEDNHLLSAFFIL